MSLVGSFSQDTGESLTLCDKCPGISYDLSESRPRFYVSSEGRKLTGVSFSGGQIGTCVTKNGHPQPRIIWFKGDQPLAEVKDRMESKCCKQTKLSFPICVI